jgi:UPF0042 nucleotide-binding protein
MELILISGLSGSGKSIALRVLEDSGYYCVDNLPAPLLQPLVHELAAGQTKRVAVAMDVRGGASLSSLPQRLKNLRAEGVDLQFLFLEARDDVLMTRFSETRRRHPLASNELSLEEAIREERLALAVLAELGHRIDTSELAANTLRGWLKEFLDLGGDARLTLLFESFGFKHGNPLDADLVFDVRCLPNPYYDPALRPLTGKDQGIISFLEAIPEVQRMAADIRHFVASWLPNYNRDNRGYLTVAIGCTGGQHRSVYFAERLANEFSGWGRVLVRHRNMKAMERRGP